MRTGKIARLPKQLRLTVNCMMDDNTKHKAIIADLEKHRAQWPPDIKSITTGNLSQWRKGGYQDWLRDQAINDQLHMVCESAKDAPSGTALANLLSQLMLLQLYQRLAAFEPSTIKPEHLQDPKDHVRLMNAGSRIIRSTLAIQKHNANGTTPRGPSQSSDPSEENLQPFSRENLRKFERSSASPKALARTAAPIPTAGTTQIDQIRPPPTNFHRLLLLLLILILILPTALHPPSRQIVPARAQASPSPAGRGTG